MGHALLCQLLTAADLLTCAAMWTVVPMTYAKRVDMSGAPLPADAFKPIPEGHTGGSLNMVPAFVGYPAANAFSATTRSWLMGKGNRSEEHTSELKTPMHNSYAGSRSNKQTNKKRTTETNTY